MEEEVVITNTSIVLLLKSPKDEIVESQYNLSVASSGISCNGANSSGNPSLLTQNDSLFGGESKKPIYALFKSSRILTNQGDILIRTSHDEDTTDVLCHETASSQSLSLSECNNPSDLSVILSRKSSLILEADSKTSDPSTASTTTVEKAHSPFNHHPRGSLLETTAYEHQIVSLTLEHEHPVVACDSESVVWRCTGGPYLRKVRRRIQSKETLLASGLGAQSDDDLYESIYEVVNPPHGNHVRHPRRSYDDFDSESEFDEIIEEDEYQVNNNQVGPQSQYGALNNSKPLSKFAEAAGKKMKKLRRNWSLKKNDITRSLSRIRKNSRPMFPTTTGDTIFREALRRRPSRQPSFSAAKNVVKCNGQTLSNKMGDTAMFYITLNIEDINNKDQEPMAEEGGETKNASPQQPAMVVPPRTRKGSAKNNYSVVRPTEAPPLPPPKKMTSSQDQLSPGSTTSSSSDSQLPANDSLREFYVGYSEDGSSNASSSELGITDIEETYTSSLFQTEPLYQFYDRDLCSQTSTDTDTETIINEDGGLANIYQADCAQENMYESVGSRSATLDNRRSQSLSHPSSSVDVPELPARRKLKNRSSAMDLLHRSANGRRSMWGELPEVIDSGILDAISKDEKRLQEALFEVISSEASYLKSLNVLISHFMQSSKFMDVSVISKRDYRILFSDVIAVRQCSEKFLEDLENRWQASVILTGIPEIVQKHAQHHFQVYVKYCSNQVYQDRILKKLKTENPKFGETLRELESNPICQSLDMHSFLMLPMQRITRLPLLIDAIYHRLNTHSQEYNSCKEALQILNKIVKECNESARNMERMEELLLLSHQLDFKDVRAVPLISASRWLVKRGEVTRIWWRDNAEARLTFGRKVNRQTLTLFLFTDLLVIAKKKGDEQFTVVDHCPRNLVTLAEVDSLDGIPGGGKYLSENNMCWLTLLQNHDSKTVEWLISFNFESDRLRWIEQVTPQQSHNPEEKIYEEWDCPQVEGVANYATQDSDELALQIGETANVLRKLSDSVECHSTVSGDMEAELESSVDETD